jgi:hypothetical protein
VSKTRNTALSKDIAVSDKPETFVAKARLRDVLSRLLPSRFGGAQNAIVFSSSSLHCCRASARFL